MAHIDDFHQRLDVDEVVSNATYTTLVELLDLIESLQSPKEYPYFLEKLLPVFLRYIKEVPVSFKPNSIEHKIRSTILQIFHRLLFTEAFNKYKTETIATLMNALKLENEDNGVLCIKVLAIIYKLYSDELINEIQPFLDIIYSVYDQAPQIVQYWFNDPSDINISNNAAKDTLNLDDENDNMDSSSNNELLPALSSFKTLSECPITMVSLLSAYKTLITPVLTQCIPKIIELMKLEAEPQKLTRQQYQLENKLLISISPAIKNRSLFCDFVLSQVKATSFLSYIFLRDYASDVLLAYHSIIPDLICRLFQDCPTELFVAKKELLHALRHILSTAHKSIFVPKLDLLFNESVLIGNGLTARQTLSSFAYNLLADFVHNIRSELNSLQTWKAVLLFTRIIRDDDLPFSTWLASAKLLLNLSDRITGLAAPEARRLYVIIIEAFTYRIETVNDSYNDTIKKHELFKKEERDKENLYDGFKSPKNSRLPQEPLQDIKLSTEKEDEQFAIDNLLNEELNVLSKNYNYNTNNEHCINITDFNIDPDFKMEIDNLGKDEHYDVFTVDSFDLIQLSNKQNSDALKESQTIIKTLLVYLKVIFNNLKMTNPPVPNEDFSKEVWNEVARGFTHEEVSILESLFHESVLCIKFFHYERRIIESKSEKIEEKDGINGKKTAEFDARTTNIPISASTDEKELMETISAIFTKVDSATFNEAFQSQFSFLMEQTLLNPALLHITHFLLTNKLLTGNIMGISVAYLKNNMQKIGKMDPLASQVILRLLKLTMMALNIHPDINSLAVLPNLADMILNCFKYSTDADEPLVYFHFLKLLFKSIGGGRFDILCEVINPLMQKILESLNLLINIARTPQERDLCIEICLLIPVRLSKLVTLLHYLMKPLVLALTADSPELTAHGLRTFELCIDNLNADFLDPIIEPYSRDILKALWKHLKPQPQYYVHSQAASRILGKLGGRNRKLMHTIDDLETVSSLNQRVEAAFEIKGLDGLHNLSITSGINAAIKLIEDTKLPLTSLSVHYRANAFRYISTVLQLFFDASEIPENYQILMEQAVTFFTNNSTSLQPLLENVNIRDVKTLRNEEQLIEKLLKAIFQTAATKELSSFANELITQLCDHFVQLYICRSLIRQYKHGRAFSVEDGEGKIYLDATVFFGGILYALSSHSKDVRESGIKAIKRICDACNIIFGTIDNSLKFGIHASLVAVFYHACYDEAYYNKLGGVLGLKTMVCDANIPLQWFAKYQFELLRALFFVLRDTPSVMPCDVINIAQELILVIVEGCNANATKLSDLHLEMVNALVYYLASSNTLVRRTALKVLKFLSSISKVSLLELVTPGKSVLLSPIFGKPLRALPFLMQIGHIEAVTFWLELPHTQVEFHDEIQRLLLEVVSLVEAEDSLLTSSDKLIDYDTREQLTELRVVCIKLLTMTILKPEYATNPALSRIRLMAIFFKTLDSSEKEIVDASYKGLEIALSLNNKLPKDLLQAGLRPMLSKLSDYQKLTTYNLETLSRLLILLLNYFKVEIGKKLLDHLASWAVPRDLHKIADYDLSSIKIIPVINAIFNIYHLLPPKAYIFIPDVLKALLTIEANLRRVQGSIFRVPIGKFLNKYPNESFKFFLENFQSRRLQTCHSNFITSCDKLRAVARENIEEFYNSMTFSDQEERLKVVKFANMVEMIYSIVYENTVEDIYWLKEKRNLLSRILTFCSLNILSSSSPYIQVYHLQLSSAYNKLQKLIIKSTDFANLDNLFINMVELNSRKDVRFFKIRELDEFLLKYIIKSDDIHVKKTSLAFSVDIISNKSYLLLTKIFFMKHIAVRILTFEAYTYGNLDRLYTNDNTSWLTSIIENIWKSSNDIIVGHTASTADFLRLETLQLTSCILKYSNSKCEPFKKDIIKYCWNLVSLEDVLSKFSAYLATCYFINAFETHPKITSHIFYALLKADNADARFIVEKSLDLLAAVISNRLGNEDLWIKWPRKVILETNFLASSMYIVYKFIVDHEELFFNSRELFLPNTINAIGKLTISPTSTAEIKLLAIELCELIIKWEKRANMNRDTLLNSELSSDYRLPDNQKEAFVTFLVRHICISYPRGSSTLLGKRSLCVFYDCMNPDIWKVPELPLNIFERFLVTFDANNLTSNIIGYTWNALDALGLVLENKSSKWIIENLKTLKTLLKSVIKCTIQELQEILQRPLRCILWAINEEKDNVTNDQEVETFILFLISTVSTDFGNTSSIAAGITLLSTIVRYKPESADPLIHNIVRIFSKLCKDYITIMNQKPNQSNTTNPMNIEKHEEYAKTTAKLLTKILDFSAYRLSFFNENRRPFLTILAHFIERSSDKNMLDHIITIAYKWVFYKTGNYPTDKENGGILSKMLGFEGRREVPIALSKEFLRIILKVFENNDNTYPITTELKLRLEPAFMAGTRFVDVNTRMRFMKCLNESIDDDIRSRLYYIFKEQCWEDLADFSWLIQASIILFESFKKQTQLHLSCSNYKFSPLKYISEIITVTNGGLPQNIKFTEFLASHQAFLSKIKCLTADDIISPLIEIMHNDVDCIDLTWKELFPTAYKSISKSEQATFSENFSTVLCNENVVRVNGKNNVIKPLISAANRCEGLAIAPHLVKYLGCTFKAQYEAIEYLEGKVASENQQDDSEESLIETYLDIGDKDMFYGIWRRRSKYNSTVTALSFEQIGNFEFAMRHYEASQIRSRTNLLPYSEKEYALWEDNWIGCAERLQQWETLTELAKHENYTDLLLECGWRVANWSDDKQPLEQAVKSVIDVPTPRRQTFKTFLTLQDFLQKKSVLNNVLKMVEEENTLILREWAKLPGRFTNAHITLLHEFQQCVEFSEASKIYNSLISTNTQNIETKLQELKRVLQKWRERLPNVWDDINLWNDLTVWRQHFYHLVNNIYTPFLQAGKGNSYSQVYSGYHEIANLINKFAHVARKHELEHVCNSQLNKIYNLPNIEILEAFNKLIEQIKCYYKNDAELYTGLDVISNTNLAYFNTTQRAQFFVMKGMFYGKLDSVDKANISFSTAIQLDNNLPKAWAKWGLFNYRMFKQSNKSNDVNEVMKYASNALVCFLHAVGLFKNSKSRRYLALILWLISLDDDIGTLSSTYQTYKGEVPVWYWITYIPQLLTSLSHKEAKFVRDILILIAKTYPQALHFPLRTTNEDFLLIQRQISQQGSNENKDTNERERKRQKLPSVTHPWEYVEEIRNISKTSYPLLALSLESIVSQIIDRFKSNADEDAYRLISALYNDGLQSFNKMLSSKDGGHVPGNMISHLVKFAETVLSQNLKIEFEKDLILSKPTYEIYVKKLIKWKRRLENKLDRRFNKINLENLCPHLTEFHHQKFEDIEIPGQYLLNKDSNTNFAKIERFLPTLEVVRGYNGCHKRMKIRGKDGSIHQFAVQSPSTRHSRREERIFQLFRILECALDRNVECRYRSAKFTLPVAVALSPHVRLMSNDNDDLSLQEIYEQICKKREQAIEEPYFYITGKLKATFDPKLPRPEIISTMTEILSAVQTLYAPTHLLKDYFMNLYFRFEDFWIFRRQFIGQYGSFIFMTYMMSITSRQPQKIHINTRTGSVWTSEMLPNKIGHSKQNPAQELSESIQKIPVFINPEAVPFRLTPNIQTLIGNVGIEGVLSVYVLVIAKCLCSPDFEIENFLSLFVRDEVVSWFAQNLQSSAQGPHLKDIVRANVDLITNKVTKIGHVSLSALCTTQNINELIATAVNPRSLAQMEYLWRSYL